MKNTVKKIIATIAAAMTIAATGLTASAFAAEAPSLNYNAVELTMEPTEGFVWRFNDIETTLVFAPDNARFSVSFTEPLKEGYSLDFTFRLKDGRTKIFTAESSEVPMMSRTVQIPVDEMLAKLHISAYDVEDMKITGASADRIIYVQLTDNSFIAE